MLKTVTKIRFFTVVIYNILLLNTKFVVFSLIYKRQWQKTSKLANKRLNLIKYTVPKLFKSKKQKAKRQNEILSLAKQNLLNSKKSIQNNTISIQKQEYKYTNLNTVLFDYMSNATSLSYYKN